MKNKFDGNITKSCALCEYAKKIELTGDILCTQSKNLKKVTSDYVCRKFSFDILSYRPYPAKIPKFNINSPDEIM